MKSRKFETGFDLLSNFVLTIEEMMAVRGGGEGEGDPTNPPPPIPPPKP